MSEKKRIMIIDDTPANLEVLSQILMDAGYEVMEFPRGSLALKPAESIRPDLILLDIMMPDMDGYETCRQLKSRYSTKDIPVVFLSAVTETEDKVRAFTSGGVDFVSKPFQAPEVLARVRTHINMSEMRRELERYNEQLEDMVDAKVQELFDSQMATLQAISSLAEYRDEDTGLHIERTRGYCRMIAVQLKQHSIYSDQINDSFIRDIYHAAPLHDIGKVAIPDAILLKKGPLTEEEFEVIKTHVTIGVQALQEVLEKYPKNSFVNMGISLTAAHHEKWDGSGYPKGLSGTAIHLAGRIMAVADVYDALRSKRPYKVPMTHEEACEIVHKGSGTHFDPEVVKAFDALSADIQLVSTENN